ncbi:hypothetical protein FSS13T_27470 [Flavobacterium saliperosum S13]|uniref:Uncharacterized protein n=1 Tax=Flavobacterium saliperosum S13 TaxID=1341155 RepID=A0ABN0QD19_9FLAO|nr:hypothetical protein FSS13T_27470 [Flavobacterium saliperosum S13]
MLIPFLRTSPCKISTKSFCKTVPIFFCLFVSMGQKYDFFKLQSLFHQFA